MAPPTAPAPLAGAEVPRAPRPHPTDATTLRTLLLDLLDPDLSRRPAALAKLATVDDRRLLVVLRQGLGARDPARRAAALEALGQRREPSASWLLAEVAADPARPGDERSLALEALGAQSTELAADLLWDLAATPAGSDDAQRSLQRHYAERAALRAALARGEVDALGERPGDAELATLLAALAEGRLAARRAEAARGLGSLGDERALPALEAALQDTDPEVRGAALQAVGATPGQGATLALARTVDRGDLPLELRRTAARGLLARDDALAAGLLVDLVWEHPPVFAGPVDTPSPDAESNAPAAAPLEPATTLEQAALALLERRSPARARARAAERPEQVDATVEVELLLDLLQIDSRPRQQMALARIATTRADLVPALVAFTGAPGLRREALRALGLHGTPAARAALATFIADRRQPMRAREDALRALAGQPSEDAALALVELHPRLAEPELRALLASLLTRHHPEQAREAGLYVADTDRRGLVPMALATATHGAIAMALLSDVTNPSPDKITFLPAMGGAVLGGAAPLLLTRHGDVTLSQAAWVGSGGGWGLASGALLALSLSSGDDNVRLGEGITLGGQVAGLTATWFTRDGPGARLQQVGLSNGGWIAGGLLGLGIARQQEAPSDQLAAAWALGGSGAGLLAGTLAGPHTQLEGNDRWLVASSVALGGWTGAFGMDAARPEHDEAAAAGVLIGLGVGYGAGVALASTLDPSARDMGLAWSGFGLGTALGLGAGLSVPSASDRALEVLMLAGGWGGLAGMLAAREELDLDTGDAALVALGTGWGAWQGLAVRSLLEAEGARSFWGATLLGSAAGAGVALAASPLVSVPPAQVGRAASGGALGGLIGCGAGLLLPEANERGVVGAALAASWAGLLLKGLYVPEASFTAADAMAVPAGGAWGLLQGHLIAEAVELSGDRADGARLLGAGLGLLTGEAFARAFELPVAALMLTEISGYAGSALGAGVLLLGADSDGADVALATALGGWAGQLGVGLVAESLQYRRDDSWEYLFGQGFGLWQGLGLAAWADTKGQQASGGALVGMAAGWFVPLASNQLIDYSPHDDLLIAGAAMWGTWLGGWAPYAFDGDGDDSLLGALVVGDVGLLLAALALSPALDVPTSTLGWSELGGIGGLALGVSGTAIFTDDNRHIATGMLIGSGVGLVTGALVAPWLSGRRERQAANEAPAQGATAGSSGARSARGRGANAGLPGLDDITLLPLTTLLPPPPAHPDAGPAWVMGVEGRW